MQGILYEADSFLVFLFITFILGGGAAWMTGRACARTWKPLAVMMIYVAIIGLGVRFIHFSIFSGTLLSVHYYVADTIVLEIIGFLSFRFTKAGLMVRQYYWLYQSAGPFAWRQKG
jgi:hypothetical protein